MSPMRTDIRIIEVERFPPLKSMFEVCQVVYDNDSIIYDTYQLDEFGTMQEAFEFCDKAYQATLKPTLLQNTKGEFV